MHYSSKLCPQKFSTLAFLHYGLEHLHFKLFFSHFGIKFPIQFCQVCRLLEIMWPYLNQTCKSKVPSDASLSYLLYLRCFRLSLAACLLRVLRSLSLGRFKWCGSKSPFYKMKKISSIALLRGICLRTLEICLRARERESFLSPTTSSVVAETG